MEPKLAIMESMVCKAKPLFLKVCLVRSLSEGSGFDEPHDEMELYQALWTGPFLCFEPGQQPVSLSCSERQPVGSLCYSRHLHSADTVCTNDSSFLEGFSQEECGKRG